jgi:MYXO-CTERM domain-containing protein
MRRMLLVAVAALLALPGAAAAHQGNPNFRSDITAVTPKSGGVTLDVLDRDDRLELINHSAQTVVVYGYEPDPDPYARILPDGTVQVNRDSPAAYLNEDRYQEGVKVPAGVDGKGAPRWKLVDKTGRFEWHDHRIHYMAKGTPPQVKDAATETKVFDWAVPLQVGASRGAIKGALLWIPDDTSGPPVGAIIGFAALLLGGVALVVVTRRRRKTGDEETTEAW